MTADSSALFNELLSAYVALEFQRTLDLATRMHEAGFLHPIQAAATAHAGHMVQDAAAYLRGLALIDEVVAAGAGAQEALENFVESAIAPLAVKACLANTPNHGMALFEIVRRAAAGRREPQPRFVEATDNAPITDREVADCIALIDRLRAIAPPSSDLWAEVAPEGATSVHPQNFFSGVRIDREFLESLRGRALMFSGIPLAALADTPTEAFALSRLHRLMTRGLAQEDVFSLPPKAGNRGFMIDDLCVNMDTISYQERVTLLRSFGLLDRLDRVERPVILEIGGGFGALAYFLKRRYPHALYVIVDLPESLVYSACYLALALGTSELSIGPDCPDGKLALVPYQLIDQLPDFGVDLAINTLSFGEMSADIVERYARFIKGRLKPQGVLFEQNYALRGLGANFSNPPAILSRWFDFQIACKAKTWRGAASLWSGREFFAPGFDWPLDNLG